MIDGLRAQCMFKGASPDSAVVILVAVVVIVVILFCFFQNKV